VRLNTLCRTHCPYRPHRHPSESADDVTGTPSAAGCAATPGECQQWLGQYGFVRRDPARRDPAKQNHNDDGDVSVGIAGKDATDAHNGGAARQGKLVSA
jgi:hypothetical protein